MFERTRDYPNAVTASSARGGDGVAQGVRWVLEQLQLAGGQVLLYVPNRKDFEDQPLLKELSTTRGVATETWLTILHSQWRGGPVLAAWPDERKLGEIADDRRTMALCVIPWGEQDVDAWRRAVSPQLLGDADLPQDDRPLLADPVLVQGLRTLTLMVNHANNLAGALDKRDAIAVLRTLYDGGHTLAPNDIYTWALAHGWPARGAGRLKEFATDIAAGKRPRVSGPWPLRAGILAQWREEAARGQ